MDLKAMLKDGATPIDEIAAALDSLTHEQRVEQTFSLGRTGQRALYQRAESSAPVDLAHFVPPERAPREPVRHHGRNSLPLPNTFRLFEKRFCRPADGSNRLFGYNEAPIKETIGPGYFVAVPTNGHAGWSERGAVVVDYFQVPDDEVAEGWPRVVPNTKGLQWFVYNKTRDFMRRVSEHVSIGAAYKVEKSLDHYFVLVRES